MEDYICKNPDCGEEWEMNNQGGLIPGAIDSGYWEHISNSNNCPACELDIKEDIFTPMQDWKWNSIRYPK